MRLAVLGDFHGPTKLAAYTQFLREARPDVVLQVGDCQYYEDQPLPFYFTHGNHEDWTVIEALRAGRYQRRNLHYLHDAEPLNLGGLKVLALGGVSRKDSVKTSPKFFDPAAYEAISRMPGIDIMLTHDTPLRFHTGRADPSLTCEEYRLLAQVVAPRFWFSGHHHHFEVEHLGPTTLISLGKFPHEWAILDLDASGKIVWSRWTPLDQTYYNAKLPGWREAEQANKKAINAVGALRLAR